MLKFTKKNKSSFALPSTCPIYLSRFKVVICTSYFYILLYELCNFVTTTERQLKTNESVINLKRNRGVLLHYLEGTPLAGEAINQQRNL